MSRHGPDGPGPSRSASAAARSARSRARRARLRRATCAHPPSSDDPPAAPADSSPAAPPSIPEPPAGAGRVRGGAEGLRNTGPGPRIAAAEFAAGPPDGRAPAAAAAATAAATAAAARAFRFLRAAPSDCAPAAAGLPVYLPVTGIYALVRASFPRSTPDPSYSLI